MFFKYKLVFEIFNFFFKLLDSFIFTLNLSLLRPCLNHLDLLRLL